MSAVKIYKVVVPSWFVWPMTQTTLKVTMTREAAERFVENYPNLALKWLMKIEEEEIEYPETD